MQVSQTSILTASRKDKPVGNILGAQFLWAHALDAAADVYNGVSTLTSSRSIVMLTTLIPVRLLVYADLFGAYCVV